MSIKKYPMNVASTICTEWCRKMQFFYDLWGAQGDDNYCFMQEDVDSYTWSEAWRALMEDIPLVGPTMERVQVLEALSPSRP